MSAYWIAHVDVNDAETYSKYAEVATQAIAEHGGKFLARGGRFKSMEGDAKERNVIVEFDSVEDAVACYNSATYAKALDFARASSKRDLLIVEGV